MLKRPFAVVFIMLVIFVLLCGIIQKTDEPAIKECKDDKVDAKVTGDVYKITSGKDSTLLWIKDSSVMIISGNEEVMYSNIGNIIIYTECDYNNYNIGNRIEVTGKIGRKENASNQGGFDAFLYYHNTFHVDYYVYGKEISTIDEKRNVIKDSLYHFKIAMEKVICQIFDEKEAGIINAMIYGDKSSMDEEIKELFQANGISHILAISGLHVSIIAGIFYNIVRSLIGNLKISTIVTIVFVFAYGVMTDFSVSTSRAVVMMIIMMVGRALGRTYDMITAIGISGIIILIQNYNSIYLASFLLSFLAVIAVAAVYPVMCKIIGFEEDDIEQLKILRTQGDWYAINNINTVLVWVLRSIKKSCLVSFCITLLTIPVILSVFYEFNVYSILLNIIIIPLMSIVVIAALLTGVIGVFNIQIAFISGGCVHYILKFYIWLCEITTSIPMGKIRTGKPSCYKIGLYYILLIVLLISGRYLTVKIRSAKCFFLMFPALVCILFNTPDGKLHVDMLDVGQGDGICITMPDGKVILVDGGSSSKDDVGKYVIEPYLKFHGKWDVEYVLLSHPDNDHINGIMQLIEREIINIKNIVLPNITTDEKKYEQIVSLANEHGICVQYLSMGDSISTGNVNIDIYHPVIGYVCSDSNEYSQVFNLRYGDFSMIFTGDINNLGEEKMIEELKKRNITIDTDILKVAHHGSNGSGSEEFLEYFLPKYAIISAGKNNRYGHPGKNTMERLKNMNIETFVTIDCGQISVVSDGDGYYIDTYK